MGFLSQLFGEPPQPPNPILTAGAQTASNIGTAITGSYLNNVNQKTPAGSVTYNPESTYAYTDPLTGQVYQVPRWTATQSYSPEGQAAFDAQQRTASNLARTGEAASNRIGGILGTDFRDTFNAAPQDAPMDWINWGQGAQTNFGDVGPGQRWLGPHAGQQTTFDDTGGITRGFGGDSPITRDYGPADNYSADRERVEASLFKRMDPQLQQDRERLRQQLADQGIRYGSPAYETAMAQADRQTTDARLAVTAAGGAEQQRMDDMAARRAGFQNAAQQQAFQQAKDRGMFENAAQEQAYKQALGRGTFANQAQLEQFQKDLQEGNFVNEAQKNAFTQEATRGQFFNAAQAQNLARSKTLFDAQNAKRERYLAEQYALRAQPISEISALQSGSQVAQPSWAPTSQSQIANTDVAGIINANFSQNLDIYKQNSNNLNNIIGGLFGLASAGVKAAPTSDRRAKKNIARVGSVYAAKRHDDPKKLPIYSYEYKDGHEDSGARRHIGPMAQDVEKIDPQAVTTRDGVKHIKTGRVMGDILRVA